MRFPHCILVVSTPPIAASPAAILQPSAVQCNLLDRLKGPLYLALNPCETLACSSVPIPTPCRVLRLLDRWRWVNVLRLVRLFVFVVLVAHWTACAWHGMYEWITGEEGVRLHGSAG